MSVSPDAKNTKTQTEVLTRAIGYQKEVKKCDLILHLKFDTDVQETKLEGSEFQSGITSTKKEDLKDVVLTRGMKNALSWWRRGEGEGYRVT